MNRGALHIASVAIASLSTAATAQNHTASGAANATVVAPLQIVPLADLDFGAVSIAAGAAGSVTIDSNGGGQARYSGNAAPACGAAAPGSDCRPHPAQFVVRGEAQRAYRVRLPASVVATGANGGSSLTVTNLGIGTMPDATDTAIRILDGEGRDTFAIGGTLIMPEGTKPGHYRADIPIIVTYR